MRDVVPPITLFKQGTGTAEHLPVLAAINSCVLRDSTPRFAGPSVCPSGCQLVRLSVTLYFFGVLAVFGLTAPAQMIW